jgi:hypothetical protein
MFFLQRKSSTLLKATDEFIALCVWYIRIKFYLDVTGDYDFHRSGEAATASNTILMVLIMMMMMMMMI